MWFNIVINFESVCFISLACTKVLLFCFAEQLSVGRPKKFELLSLYASKGSYTASVTTFESNFVGRSIENIRQSKTKAP